MLASTAASCVAAWLVTLDLVIRIDLTPWLKGEDQAHQVAVPLECPDAEASCGDVISAEPTYRQLAAGITLGFFFGIFITVLVLNSYGVTAVAGGSRPRYINPSSGDRGSRAATLRGRTMG